MIRINLLPRDETPSQHNLKLPNLGTFAPLVLIIVAVGAMAILSLYQGQNIAHLEDQIGVAEAESRRLAPEIAKIKRLDEQRSNLNQRLEVIGTLDRDRYFRVHLMDEMNRSLPEHLWLTRWEENGDGVALEGVTFSNFLVSDLLQNLDRSPYFTNVNLLIAEKGRIEDVDVVKFKIQTRAVRPVTPAMYGG